MRLLGSACSMSNNTELAAKRCERFLRRKSRAQEAPHAADVERELSPVVHSAELDQRIRFGIARRLSAHRGDEELPFPVARRKRKVLQFPLFMWITCGQTLWRFLWIISHAPRSRTGSPTRSPSFASAEASRAAISMSP